MPVAWLSHGTLTITCNDSCSPSPPAVPCTWHRTDQRATMIIPPERIRFVVITLFGGMHDDVIKWKHFPHYWPFVRGIHRSPVNSPHKGQWRGALMFSLICALSKQSCGWWFETPSRSLWRHHVAIVFGIDIDITLIPNCLELLWYWLMHIIRLSHDLLKTIVWSTYEEPTTGLGCVNSLRPSDAYMRR